MIQMISRHFDLDRVRGSLITSQSIFLVELDGYSVADLQEFSSNLMRVLNQIPSDQWPNQRMLGEFLFHKLRTVRRWERVIDEIKRSPPCVSSTTFGVSFKSSWLKNVRMSMLDPLSNPFVLRER